MRPRDTFDVMSSLTAVIADSLAVFGGFMLAWWLRFRSGWIPLFHEGLPPTTMYVYGAAVGTLLLLFIYRSLGLYVRPQSTPFADCLPRITKATILGILLTIALAFAIRTEPPYSRLTVAISLATILILVSAERGLLYRLEEVVARRMPPSSRVAIAGTDQVAVRMRKAIQDDPRMRAAVVGFLTTGGEKVSPGIDPGEILGSVDEVERLVHRHHFNRLVLVDTALPREKMLRLMLACEKELVDFLMVPDLFRILTTDVEIQNLAGIPVLGLKKWPLDYFWNRVIKRIEDIVGAVVGLVVSVPVTAAAAPLIKRQSPGPVFYRQERCGEHGRIFTIYKLRTMRVDAEKETGPVWAVPDDPRCTPIGSFLRRHNLDELPQFWNVLKGDMSLVGPRPERPEFVEKFRGDIGKYMWRHVSRPGMTGWAQVNGLRGNTSLRERIKYDLYYLENWSLLFDLKIILRTLFSRKNAC
ncbi:MAG TPA: undecaprenyl-phosphate glucose phosphotransferase [Kiritimatiellae bacterium]|nr:undecaprenyl-phosphate glucose phosphotransferase [Kiritimatiellia bacterium]